MTTEPYKAEVEALGAILQHLEPLGGPARERVIDYVLRALDIAPPEAGAGDSTTPLIDTPPADPDPDYTPREGDRLPDIRALTEEKKPRSATEMAAIVGYYLGELAQGDERKDAIETADLERLFKHAKYPLPGKMRAILGNAAAAGYFDQVSRGQYKLNPVGYNLVVHNLPSGDAAAGAPRKRAAKKAVAKKAPAKKAAANKAPAKKAAANKAPAKKAAAKKTAS